jgi:hypothetical protein
MKWISVEDRLPEEDMRVLTYNVSRIQPIEIDYLVFSEPQILWANEMRHDERTKVTHWMSLPEIPDDLD